MKKILIGIITGTILGIVVALYLTIDGDTRSAILSMPTLFGLMVGLLSGVIFNTSASTTVKIILSVAVGALIFYLSIFFSGKEFDIQLLTIGGGIGLITGLVLSFVRVRAVRTY
jgi:hypothetical protein